MSQWTRRPRYHSTPGPGQGRELFLYVCDEPGCPRQGVEMPKVDLAFHQWRQHGFEDWNAPVRNAHQALLLGIHHQKQGAFHCEVCRGWVCDECYCGHPRPVVLREGQLALPIPDSI